MAKSPLKIVHFIDQPTNWSETSHGLIIRGWAFGPKTNPIQAIRLRTPALSFGATLGKFRPDVKAALPDAPDDYTGFEIRATLPVGKTELAIEAQITDQCWTLLVSQTVDVSRRWMPLWLGGGNWSELMITQAPCHMEHRPRAINPDRFPSLASPPKSRPKLTIVTPSFQQAQFLSDTVRSVLRQTETRFEYVVQDGGSSDGSAELMRRFSEEQPPFADYVLDEKTLSVLPSRSSQLDGAASAKSSDGAVPRVMFWESKPDNGQADAIAKGFAKTSGSPEDLMGWINSDDFYLPGTFAFVVDFFARHPEVDVIYGHRLLVNEASQEIGRWFLPAHDDEVLKLYDFVPQETTFWRRRIWDKVGGIDPSYKFAMDWDLLLRFQAAGAQIMRVPYFLACFRIHPSQKTAAQMDTVGQREIDVLRLRTQRRSIPPSEIETHPKLLRYLRRSAWIRFLWRLGIRR